ncbi:MAG TPA: ASKHA domain-containing protein [Victivallales bacterium]|nr:ASKHA domain-containing protein [Victivallales bacterium]
MTFSLIINYGGSKKRIEVGFSTGSKPLSETLKENGLAIWTSCGGNGICSSCEIKLLSGHLIRIKDNKKIEAGRNGIILKSCLVTLPENGNAEIEILKNLYYDKVMNKNILISKIKDLKTLPEKSSSRKKQKKYLGIAVDIGTTTVEAVLFYADTGKIIDQKSIINSQIKYAVDVLSRIKLCFDNNKLLKLLQENIVEKSFLPLISSLLENNDYQFENILKIYIAGNTTMLHIFLGEDPTSIGLYPFTPKFLDTKSITLHELISDKGKKSDVFINEKSDIEIRLLPGISAYVGADILSGCYALDIVDSKNSILFIDIGTNGEILLKVNNKVFACSSAAGPTFEGFNLSCGTTAVSGAVRSIKVDKMNNILTETINNKPAGGICGSGYIDFLAEAKLNNIVNVYGRYTDEFNDFLCFSKNSGKYFCIGSENIFVSESDISLLLQAKAAIASGIQVLLNKADIKQKDIDLVYIAGGFGANLNIDNSIMCGLLEGFNTKQISIVGNTSLMGAYCSFFDNKAFDKLNQFKKSIEIVSLNEEPDFQNIYIDNLRI